MTYFGHSVGGLFGSYVLPAATSTFHRYILSSPSLWWDHHVIFDLELHGARTGALDTEVFFGIGALETDAGRRREASNLPNGHPAKPPSSHLDMVDDMRRFIARLASRNDPTLGVRVIEAADEFHATVPGIVLTRALRSFYPLDAERTA